MDPFQTPEEYAFDEAEDERRLEEYDRFDDGPDVDYDDYVEDED